MEGASVEWLLCFLFILFKECCCLNLTGILVPRYKLEGEDALLECQYQLPEKSLYAVKWYKTDEEFFKYVQRANPPTTSYPVEGINVDHARSDRRRVLLRHVSPLSSGVYRCEVSAEAPSFSSATAAARMTVQHLPEAGPHITGERKQYLIGDEVNLNCTSGKSYPASVLHWYINDLEVKTEEQGLQPYPEVRAEGGLLSSQLGLGLRLMKYHFRRGRAELRCIASYPLPDPRQAPEGEALTAGGQGATRILHQQQQPRHQNRWEAVLLVTLNGARDAVPTATTILVTIVSLLLLCKL